MLGSTAPTQLPLHTSHALKLKAYPPGTREQARSEQLHLLGPSLTLAFHSFLRHPLVVPKSQRWRQQIALGPPHSSSLQHLHDIRSLPPAQIQPLF